MARIPEVTSIQRVNPQDRTGVTSRRNLAGQGTEGIANALSNMAERQVDFQAQKARADFIKAKTEVERELEQEPGDYTDLADRYQQKLKERTSEIAQGIGSGRRQQLFMQDAEADIAQGTTRMTNFAFKLERDDGRADTQAKLKDLRETFLNSEEPEQAVETMDGLLESAVEARYLTEQEAEDMRTEWRNDAAVGRISMLDPESQLEALEQPWATNLPSDTRARLKREAEAKRRGFQAQQAVDGYLSEGMDRKQVMRDIRERYADEPDLRKAVEQRFEYAAANRERIEREEQEQASEQAMEAVLGGAAAGAEQMVSGGTAVDKLPDSVRKRLDRDTESALRQVEMMKARGEPITTNPNTYYELTNLAGSNPTEFANTNLVKYRHRLSETDYETLQKVKQQIREGKKGKESEGLEALASRNAVTNEVMEQFGINAKESPNEAAQFREKAQGMLSEYQRRNDNELPSPEEWRRMIKAQAVNTRLEESSVWNWWDPETARAFQLPPGAEAIVDVDDVPEMDKRLIAEALREEGFAVTDEAIVQRFMEHSGLRVSSE